MNTQDLFNQLYAEPCFGGVIGVDQLPDHISMPTFFVVNTSVSSTPGLRWLCLYFPINSPPEVFDSLAINIYNYHTHFESVLLNNSKSYLRNTKRIQNYGSETCGEHCVFFAKHRVRRHNFKSIMTYCYTDDLAKNDKMVQSFLQ